MDPLSGWDELCLICGLGSSQGPKMLYREIDRCLDTLMWHLKGPFHRWRDRQLREEIRNILLLFERTSNLGSDSIPYTAFKKNSNILLPYFPTGSGDGRAIAIGRFNQAGAPIRGDTTRLPRGYVSFFFFFFIFPASPDCFEASRNAPCMQ
jgi:hypothetical protein